MFDVRKVAMLCVWMLLMSGFGLAEGAERTVSAQPVQTAVKLVVVPYLDSSEQDKDYVGGMLDDGYTNYFATLRGVSVVPMTETLAALKAAGYDKSDMTLPEKDVMAAVAKATGADYVIAMELSNLSAIRHESFFQYKITVNVKLEYHFYGAAQDRMIAFKTTGSNDNATIFGDVGFRSPIDASLHIAMKKANDKVVPFLQGTAMPAK